MNLLQQKSRLLKKYRLTRKKDDFEAFRKVRNLTTGTIRKEKQKFKETASNDKTKTDDSEKQLNSADSKKITTDNAANQQNITAEQVQNEFV